MTPNHPDMTTFYVFRKEECVHCKGKGHHILLSQPVENRAVSCHRCNGSGVVEVAVDLRDALVELKLLAERER